MFEKLQEAQKQHISDLRVLIDKGHEREAALVSIVQQTALQSRMPRVNPGERTENVITAAVALEHLSDVETYDGESDAAQLAAHDKVGKELNDEFNALFAEQVTEGITKP